MNVTRKTTLAEIKAMMAKDFGIAIDNTIAREVKEDCLHGMAVWTKENYASGASNPTLKRVWERGVLSTAYGTFWSRTEWNAQYE